MATAKKFETRWSYSLSYGTKEDPHRSGMSGGKDTQGETIADMFKMVTYYLSLGYEVTGVLHESCAKCEGAGRVPLKHRKMYQSKLCPACKGVRPSEPIDCRRFGMPVGIIFTNNALVTA